MFRRLLWMGALTGVLWPKSPPPCGADLLRTMSVQVSLDPAAGLDSAEVRAAVESKLRAVGIRINPKSRDALHVVVAVSAIASYPGSPAGYAYSVHVSLNQQVYLARNPNQMTQAATWETMSIRACPADGLRAACRNDIERRVEDFVAVYRGLCAETGP